MPVPENLDWIPTGETLGKGGQGTIHVVFNKKSLFGKKYALKELHNHGDEQVKERFQKEIRAIRAIKHPSIAEVFDHSKSEDAFQYYVMECFEGAQSLTELTIQSNRNPFEGNTLKSLALFEEIVKAIQVCERQNPTLLHRDISPNNILVLEDGSIRLIDFGLCQTVGDSTITLAGENLGTRNYAPPEFGSGSVLPAGIHSDIYSAAKVVWSTITSERVFDREEAIFANKSMEKMFPHNEETWHLNRIFRQTIQNSPNDRFRGTKQLLSEIHAVRHAIKGGHPPLEALESYCPSCGHREVREARDDRKAFSVILDESFTEYECWLCGYIFVRRDHAISFNVGPPIPF